MLFCFGQFFSGRPSILSIHLKNNISSQQKPSVPSHVHNATCCIFSLGTMMKEFTKTEPQHRHRSTRSTGGPGLGSVLRLPRGAGRGRGRAAAHGRWTGAGGCGGSARDLGGQSFLLCIMCLLYNCYDYWCCDSVMMFCSMFLFEAVLLFC